MLASHNSLTFLSPKGLGKLINPFVKCQNKSLIDQFYDGVRFFDFRFRFKNGKPVVAHGLATYSFDDAMAMIEGLNYICSVYKVHFRMMIEYNHKPRNAEAIIKKAISFYNDFKGSYPNLISVGLFSKWDEKIIIEDKKLPILHKYSSVLGRKRYFLIPWLYAKEHNSLFKHLYRSLIQSRSEALMLDFI